MTKRDPLHKINVLRSGTTHESKLYGACAIFALHHSLTAFPLYQLTKLISHSQGHIANDEREWRGSARAPLANNIEKASGPGLFHFRALRTIATTQYPEFCRHFNTGKLTYSQYGTEENWILFPKVCAFLYECKQYVVMASTILRTLPLRRTRGSLVCSREVFDDITESSLPKYSSTFPNRRWLFSNHFPHHPKTADE